MKTRLFVYAAVALVSATLTAPSRAIAMGIGACTPPTVTLNVSPAAPASSTPATLTCTTSAAVTAVTLTVPDGTLDASGLSTVTSLPVASGAATTWITPAGSGYFAVTCESPAVGGFSPICDKVVTLNVPIGINPPIVGGIAGPIAVVTNASASLSVTASDPNGLALTYAWTATCGAITQGAVPTTATWQAPATPGPCDVTVTVSNGVLSTPSTKTLNAVIAAFQASLPVPLDAPRRIAASQDASSRLAPCGC